MFSHNANLEGFHIDHLSCALLDHINEREWEITNWIFMTEYMYILEEFHPRLDNEAIVPHLVLCARKKKRVFFAHYTSSVHQRLKVSRCFKYFFLQQSELDKHASQSLPGNPQKDNATAKVLMKSKPLMWSVKLRMIWRILPFKWRWYNESTLNRKQLKGQIGLINLKVIPLPQMVCNIQIIIIKNLEQICSLFGLS